MPDRDPSRPSAADPKPETPSVPDDGFALRQTDGPSTGDAVRFNAILHPNRSLPPVGFFLVIALVGVASLIMGTVFLIAGAWPVFGLYGLDVALLYWAFRRSYHSGRMYETVRLTDGSLVVERVDTRGRRHIWTFQPHWMQVQMDDPPQHESQVRLVSHGRTVTIGSFLSPQERLDFANALRAAIAVVKTPEALRLGNAPASPS